MCDTPLRSVPEILEHLRVLHPDLYGDGPDRWPDGRIAVYDTTLEPRDFLTDRPQVEFHRNTYIVVLAAVVSGLALAVGALWYTLKGGAW